MGWIRIPKFNFGDLAKNKTESKKEIHSTAKIKNKPVKIPKDPNRTNKSTSSKSTHSSYVSQKEINKNFLTTLKDINNKLDLLTKQNSLLVNSVGARAQINSLETKSFIRTPSNPQINLKMPNKTVRLTPTNPGLIKNLPKIDQLGNIRTENGRIDWNNIVFNAKSLNWLYNCYTFTRFLDLIDEILKTNHKMPLGLKNKWSRLMTHEKIMKNVGIKWNSYKIKRLGKTQKHLIDTFYSFDNQFLSSIKIFSLLVDKFPEYYDVDRDNNIDLRRVRNVLSALSKGGFIEKMTNIIDKSVTYRLKRE